MKINRINLCNISSYAGESSFDFRSTEAQNVILIGGQNGTGKTSLFTALKLALYGHLCFNYQSTSSPMYLSKIKDMINHDAFTTDQIQAYVEVEIEVPQDREYIEYTIRRAWSYTNQRISEKLTVSRGNTPLKNNELVFFQNYLATILPPNLFDFFFFDGEQIADFFATNSYNSYIKNALLTLCSYDTLELIRKFSASYTDSSAAEDQDVVEEYQGKLAALEVCQQAVISANETLAGLDDELVAVADQKARLSQEFKRSGGLTDVEKNKLFDQSQEQERLKSEANLRIKSFVETRMPFVIAKDFSSAISKQIEIERSHQNHLVLTEQLNRDAVRNAVADMLKKHLKSDKSGKTIAPELLEAIVDAVKPEGDAATFQMLHNLSNEQQMKVFSLIQYLEQFTGKAVLKAVASKEKAAAQTVDINKTLREAMSEIDAETYATQFEQLAHQEVNLAQQVNECHESISAKQTELEELTLECERLRSTLQQNAKNRNVYELANKVSGLLDSMLNTLTASKFKEIETCMLAMLKKIMRKDNFIDLIELDDNFSISIYKEQLYKISDLENLIKNIGTDDLVKRLGTSGVHKLLKLFQIDSITKLKASIKKNSGQLTMLTNENITLYKKLEFNQLSKGEKQIFILSLYFAIIKVSRKDLPFIIDTPYARIDTEHREQISTVFFPNISGQVIILSTDEEITLPYYKVLKPYIAKEYLLNYNEAESKTTVTDGYFFKE